MVPAKQPPAQPPKPVNPDWAERAKNEWIEIEADRNERDE